ncbi:immunity 42 family protein [Variovorax paradoxus]|uniref:immunity 42 family protein n=1 Tax=Variovorax paradoxus TaxID=34073 RepID=UPI0021ACFB59|nr:immunity 42 family protein [Variovorax paradoxus]UVH55054.1 immunity 42 family protein [Variovorax paradoxus]
MKMYFGKKERFAIFLELDEASGREWMFGKFCYCINGRQIGDFDAGISLRDVFFQMKYIRGDRGHRDFEKLFKLPKNIFFRLMSDALSERSNEIAQYASEDFLPASLDVCPLVDIFGAWRIFLVGYAKQERLIFGECDESEVFELILPAGEFDEVFEASYLQLELMYEAAISQ